MRLSQSLSGLSQVSVDGSVWPVHVSHPPALQACVPGRQTPMPEVPGAPV